MSLMYATEQTAIFLAVFLIIIGIVGNSINILVFSSIRSYRSSPSRFYFLIASIFNLLYVSINLTTRLLITGYGVDLTRTSLPWCKMRTFFIYTLSTVSITCSYLATIDQFFLTSQNMSLRRLSNIKWTYRIVSIVVLFWCIHGIAISTCFDISPVTNTCTNVNAVFANYIPIYLLGVCTVGPMLIMSLFGYLTYRNIHKTRALRRQRTDRQLTRMALMYIVFSSTILPYTVYIIYQLITSSTTKDPNQLSVENFIYSVCTVFSYTYYCVCLRIVFAKICR